MHVNALNLIIINTPGLIQGNVAVRPLPSLSLSLSLVCVCLSPILFLSAMSCGSSEFHPRLFRPYVLPCLFRTIPPTHTHVLTHAAIHPPSTLDQQRHGTAHTHTHAYKQYTHTHTHTHSLHGNSKIGSMCLLLHSIGFYSYLFQVSVLKDFCVNTSDQNYMSNTHLCVIARGICNLSLLYHTPVFSKLFWLWPWRKTSL